MLEYLPYVGAAVGVIGIGTVLLRIGGNAATTSSDLKNLNERHASLAKECREGRAADSQAIAVMRTELSVLQVETKQMRKEIDEMKKEKASAEAVNVVQSAIQRIESGISAVRSSLEEKR